MLKSLTLIFYNFLNVIIKLMPIFAKDLKYNQSQLGKIGMEIKIILSSIDEEIKNAFDIGKTNIEYGLPSAFHIENLKSSDVRIRIHSNIVSDIAHRGFFVRYIIDKKKCYLQIAWETEQEKYRKKSELDILEYYNLHPQERGSKNKPKVEKYIGIDSLR